MQRSTHPRHTLLVGPLPHRLEGLSLAFELAIKGFRDRQLPFRVVDTSSKLANRTVGTFSVDRSIETLGELWQYLVGLFSASAIYITMGFSLSSFLRDCFMIWTAHLLRRRIVLHAHGGGYAEFYDRQPHWLQALIRATLNRVNAIVILGELLRSQFSFLSSPGSKLIVISNAIPIDISPEQRTSSKQLPASGIVSVLYMSNLIKSKGYLDCLEACRILVHERKLPIHLDFCGEFVAHAFSSERSDSAQEAKEKFLLAIEAKGLSEFVTYHGVVNGTAKKHFLSNAHIFLLPTTYAWEGQPISIIEALAYGTPVIATSHSGIPEQVVSKYNGILLDPLQPLPVQIANAIQGILEDPSGYNRMSVNALLHYETQFTQTIHLNKLIPVILGDIQ